MIFRCSLLPAGAQAETAECLRISVELSDNWTTFVALLSLPGSNRQQLCTEDHSSTSPLGTVIVANLTGTILPG